MQLLETTLEPLEDNSVGPKGLFYQSIKKKIPEGIEELIWKH